MKDRPPSAAKRMMTARKRSTSLGVPSYAADEKMAQRYYTVSTFLRVECSEALYNKYNIYLKEIEALFNEYDVH